jgi:hypothetical protein
MIKYISRQVFVIFARPLTQFLRLSSSIFRRLRMDSSLHSARSTSQRYLLAHLKEHKK